MPDSADRMILLGFAAVFLLIGSLAVLHAAMTGEIATILAVLYIVYYLSMLDEFGRVKSWLGLEEAPDGEVAD